MCGIAGSYPGSHSDKVRVGIARINHRGPDDSGVIDLTSGSLGHTRLSIIDVENGHQPMSDGRAWIVFNGEVYNFQDLRCLISSPMETNSDTEVVLRLYQHLGPESASILDGMFAYAIIEGGKLFMARDPLGIKPLYYTVQKDNLYFASEMKALQGISTEILEFPAGHWWHSDYGMRQFHQLIDRSNSHPPIVPASQEDVQVNIYQKLKSSVEKRMIADEDVPVGISLSGGLDSSIVAAFGRDVKDDLKTFAVGVAGAEDLQASIEAAEYLNTHHYVYQYTLEEMLDSLPEVIYHLESYDAPLIRSAIPNYFLAKIASEHVKVILTGEGADEIFAGYEYLEDIADPGKLQEELLCITRALHNTNLQRADRMSMAFGLEARVPFLDKEFVDYVLAIPPSMKMRFEGQLEKNLLRKACQGTLPESILFRPKSKFSEGAGSIGLLAEHANEVISDSDFSRNQAVIENQGLRSKEEFYYFQIFKDIFGERIPANSFGRTRSITADELN
jgi:asparagine synthase (glutamine-hydrolysing)